MNKNVIISVKGTQRSDNVNADTLELVTEGIYSKEGDSYIITYNESEVTGMEGTTTTLKVDGRTVTLMRFGSVNSQLIFQKGQRHLCHYDTAYGSFTIGVYANEVNIDVDDNGGEIKVDYQLEFGNDKSGTNDFYMLIREAGRPNDKCNRKC